MVVEFSIWGMLGKLKQFKLPSGHIFFGLFPPLLMTTAHKGGLLYNKA